MSPHSISIQHNRLVNSFRHSLLLIGLLALLASGLFLWGNPKLAPIPSKNVVYAQSSVKTPPQETISLRFFVAKDYKVTVEGVIDLTNVSGKDISLTQYSINLPYFTLKDTKIGYVYPNAFLVDTYSENNSILFTFKSQYTKPVVIGPQGKITFNFTATVVSPYKDIGGLRTISFPFQLQESNRTVTITVVLDPSLPLLVAPRENATLAQQHIYSLSDSDGKGFVFALSDAPINILLSGTHNVPLPLLQAPFSCMTIKPISCTNCADIQIVGNDTQIVTNRTTGTQKAVSSFAVSLTPSCARDQFKKQYGVQDPVATTKTPYAGYILYPDIPTLVPATWSYATTSSGLYLQDLSMNSVVLPYQHDVLGVLAIPLAKCTTDDACIAIRQALVLNDVSITSTLTGQISSYSAATTDNPRVSLVQQGSGFYLYAENTTDTFVLLPGIQLASNDVFNLGKSGSFVLEPKGSLQIPLVPQKVIQISNQPKTLTLESGTNRYSFTFTPNRIFILTIIEVLGYIFVISLGIAGLSAVALFIYNKRYGTQKTTA